MAQPHECIESLLVFEMILR